MQSLSAEYWFVTCYILLCLFVPVLHPFLQKITLKRFAAVLFAVFCLWYLLAAFMNSPYANLMRAFFYWCSGCFLGKFLRSVKLKKAFIPLICVIALLGILMNGTGYFFVYSKDSLLLHAAGFFLVKTGVFISAVSIFVIFKNIDVGSVKIINIIAACTFGIYLIHENAFMRPLIWYKIFDVLNSQYFSEYFSLKAFLTIMAVFSFCAVADFAMRKTEEKLYAKCCGYFCKFSKPKETQ